MRSVLLRQLKFRTSQQCAPLLMTFSTRAHRPKSPSEFPVTSTTSLRWGDQGTFIARRSARLSHMKSFLALFLLWQTKDKFGHVNNIYYLQFFEDARLAYMDRIEKVTGLTTIAFPVESKSIGIILASNSLHYLIPLEFPGNVVTGTRTKHFTRQRKRFTMEYAVFDQQNRLACYGESDIAMFDYGTQKTCTVPDNIYKAILQIEGKSIPDHDWNKSHWRHWMQHRSPH